VLPAAKKKQPVKGKPAGKSAQLNRKKEAPIVKAKPSKGPVLPAVVKKQPVKGKPAGKSEKHVEKKAAPAVKEKTFETKVISSEMDQVSEKKDVIVTEKIQTQKVMASSVDLGKRYKCYKCGIKFYDLGRPQPLCPSCGANQLDGVIKAARKRRGKQRSAYVAKTEPLHIAPGENEDLHEVVNELDAEYVLDVDDIVLEENEDTEDKE
jgi:rubrerythrin